MVRTLLSSRRVRLLLAAAGAAIALAQTPMRRGPTRSPHGTLSVACASCHTATSWSPLRAMPEFNHNRETRYPLRAMHERVECRQCHTKLVFSQAGTQCADCHADIHRRQFGARCEECHTVKGWSVGSQSVRTHSARFPLIGAHAAVDCEACHRGAAAAQFTGLSIDCASCHLKNYNSAALVDHRAAAFPTNCTMCHSMDGWRAVHFDHARFTGFALIGPHAQLDCAQCHTGNRYKGTAADCFACHSKDFQAARTPNHVSAGFPRDCSLCHTAATWSGARFDHNAATKFALTGAHVNVECASCHVGGRFAGTPKDCYSCHTQTFADTRNPDHRRSNFPTDCARCHSTQSWQGAAFDHSITKFPLTGAHQTVQCAQCHAGGNYTGTNSECASCHLDDYQRTANPNHAGSAFPQTCALCHTTANWQGARFDHNTSTRFPLTGAHVQTTCAQCHTGGRFAGTPSECSGCHLEVFNRTTNPNHTAAGFPQTCAVCHNSSAWRPASFDHAKTRFPLVGAHVRVECTRCHTGSRYSGTPAQCSGCHLADFNRTTNPNHAAAGFPQDCAICHTAAQWQGARFDHSAATKFPLSGAHVQVTFSQCHAGGRFAGTPAVCSGCHLTTFNQTTNPNHTAAGFPQTCEVCHSTAAWRPATFDHGRTSFPLTGKHTATECARCHTNNRFAGTPTQCPACHLAEYQRTSNPNHAAAGFPQDCSICHSTAQWPGAKFDHSKTRFPLTGAHVPVECARCHSSGVFAGLGTACVNCHLAKFNATTNPNHRTAGFPNQCEVCHTTGAWQPASFNHNTTQFPLTGRHTSVQCGSCHVNGVFAGTPKDCYPCHKTQFQTVTNPNHVAAGFPQTCATCHTTSTWTGARFTHNRFPIYSGNHAGKWTTCNDCHTNPADYQVFSCITCHEHDKASTDRHHGGVRNYVYNATSCYGCHPTGRGD